MARTRAGKNSSTEKWLSPGPCPGQREKKGEGSGSWAPGGPLLIPVHRAASIPHSAGPVLTKPGCVGAGNPWFPRLVPVISGRSKGASEKSGILCSWEGPLGTPLGLVQWKRASSRVEAGTSGFLSISDSDGRVPEVHPLRPLYNCIVYCIGPGLQVRSGNRLRLIVPVSLI